MKVICDGLALTEAINKVIKALPVKKNFNVLECIKLSAYDNQITLTCTDTELTIIKTISADVRIEGDILIPGKFFSDFTRKLDNESISLESINENKKLIIKYGENEGYINCLDVTEYPKIATSIDGDSLVLTKKDFKEAVDRTIFSASTEESRQILKGCLFEVTDTGVNVVALDGYRMAVCTKPYVSATAVGKRFVAPARSLNEIVKLIALDDETMTVKFTADKLFVEIDSTVIISRLISGEFVKYRNIIPSDYTTVVTLDRKVFLGSIDRATVISKQSRNNMVKMDIKADVITIDSNSEQGNMREQFSAKAEGKENIICFNGKYLMDFLTVIDDDFIQMIIKASNSPCVFKQVDKDEFLFLVLPMRITT